MGLILPPPAARLICGILACDADGLQGAEAALTGEWGPIAARSGTWPFTETDYYAAEMGPALLRRFVAFEGAFAMERLAAVKRRTNALEASLCGRFGRAADARPVNLDPGYVTLSKLVLASTKNHAHRIYLGEGIYAEITLRFTSKRWTAWPWTYPDYASGKYDAFLSAVRETLKPSAAAAGGAAASGGAVAGRRAAAPDDARADAAPDPSDS
jgi:hypothetical protein